MRKIVVLFSSLFITSTLSVSKAGVLENNFPGGSNESPYYQCQTTKKDTGVSQLNFLEFSTLGKDIIAYMGFGGSVFSKIDDQTIYLEDDRPFTESIGPTLALRTSKISKEFKKTMEKLQYVDKFYKEANQNQSLYSTDPMPFIDKQMVTFRVKNLLNDINKKEIKGLNPLSALNKMKIQTDYDILISFPKIDFEQQPKVLIGELRMRYVFLSEATPDSYEATGYNRNFYNISCERMSSSVKRDLIKNADASKKSNEFYNKPPPTLPTNEDESGNVIPFPKSKNVISRTDSLDEINDLDISGAYDIWQSLSSYIKFNIIKEHKKIIAIVATGVSLSVATKELSKRTKLMTHAKDMLKYSAKKLPFIGGLYTVASVLQAAEHVPSSCVSPDLYTNIQNLSKRELEGCLKKSTKLMNEFFILEQQLKLHPQ